VTLLRQVVIQRDLWFIFWSVDQLGVPPHRPPPLGTFPALSLFRAGAGSFGQCPCVRDAAEAWLFGAKPDLLQSFQDGFVGGCWRAADEQYVVVSHLEALSYLPAAVYGSGEFKVLFLLLLWRNRAFCGDIPPKSHILLPCTRLLT